MTPTSDSGAPVPDAEPIDELASATLDGEAAPELAGTPSTADPSVTARVETFRRVADLVGAPVEPLGDAERDRLVTTALAAWGTEAAAGDAGEGDEVAAARRRRAMRQVRLVGVAAAVVAAVTIGGLALRGGPDADDTAAEDSATVQESTAAESGAGTGASAAPLAITGDLGAFDDVDALLAAATDAASTLEGRAAADEAAPSASSAPSANSTVAAGAGVPSAELDQARCLPVDQRVVQVLTATLDDRPVLVLLLDEPDGQAIQVVDAESCEVVAERAP